MIAIRCSSNSFCPRIELIAARQLAVLKSFDNHATRSSFSVFSEIA
jgi:hypothetical protein